MSPAQVTAKVVRYELSNVARSRWLLAYAAFFAVLALAATPAAIRYYRLSKSGKTATAH